MKTNQLGNQETLTLDELDKINSGQYWNNKSKDEYDSTELSEEQLDNIKAGMLSQEEIEAQKRYLEELYEVIKNKKKACEQGRTK